MAYLGPPPARTPVTSSQITDASVTAAKLATDSVATAKIADDAVTTDKVGALTTLATNVITETTGGTGVTIDGLLLKDSTAAFADGAVATPSITNTGDVNTGIYFPAADTVGITAGGVEQFRFGSNAIPGSSKQLVRNGAMQISQRGTITGMGGANIYSALDGFEVRNSGSPQGRFTSSQVALSLGDSATAGGFRQGLKMDCTTAEDAVGTAEIIMLVTKIEAQDLQHLEWGTASAKAVTLSFTFSSPKTGVHCVSLYNYDSNTSYVAEFTIASANTYERFKITVPGPTDGGFNNDTGIGLGIQWPLVAGGNWQTTAGSWGNHEKYASSNQQNLLDNTSNNVILTGVLLEEGSVGTDYPHVSVSDEFLRNQRYLYRLQEFSTNAVGIASGAYMSTTVADFLVQFPVEMRATPTMSVSAVGDFKVSANSQVNDTTAMATIYGGSTQTTILRATTASAAGGEGALLRTDGSAGGFIQYSAEL